MGWYMNYEVVFDEHVDWDDQMVANCLSMFNCQFLCLRDLDETTIIISLYSEHDIKDILDVIYDIYFTHMSYRKYGTYTWINRS